MSDSPRNSGGWLESPRRIGEALLGLLRSRFELLGVELQEEKLRCISLLLWLVLAAALGFAGVFVAIVALAFWLWTVAGYYGLVGLAAVCLVAAVGIILGLRKKIQSGPMPFAQTVAEFRKDTKCWPKNN